MASPRMIQNNFSGGVISPSLYGRSDLQAYYKGCAVAENFTVAKEGSLRKRHGIVEKFALDGSYDDYKIFPYRYDRSQAGFLLIKKVSTNLVVELYRKDGTRVEWEELAGEVNTHITSRTITGFAGSIKELQSKQIGDQVWISNEEFFRIININWDVGKFDIDTWVQSSAPDSITHDNTVSRATTHWSIQRSTVLVSGKWLYYGVVCVKDSINSQTSKGEVRWEKSWEAGHYIDIFITISQADLSKWDYVIVAKRSGGSYGELTRFYMDDDPDVYYDANMSQIYKSAYKDEDDKPLYFNIETVYKWTDGKYYDKAEGESGAVEKTPIPLGFVRFDFRDDNIAAGTAIYGQTNVLGTNFRNPLCVDCFQQRRVFANATNSSGNLPMTLWFSEVGNINNFYADRPTADDDPFSPTISSTGPAFIRWIVSYNEMLVLLTDSGLFSVGFAQTNGFSASSCRISRFSDLAVSPDIQPVVTDAGIVFVGADNKTLYTASYDIQENMLKPINRSVLVEHLTRTSQIKAIALQTSPDNVVWVVTDNGRFSTFTFERNEEVYAWSDGFIPNASVVDVISLGSVTDSSTDRTYGDLVFIVKKSDVYYLCLPSTGYADTINAVSSNVTATLTTLRPESQEKTIVGYTKNVKDVLLRLYRTGSIAIKPTSGGADIPLVDGRMPLDPEGLYTGDVKIMPRGVINENAQMTYVSSDAKPCEILQIVSNLEVN